MRLVFYSGGEINENRALDLEMLRLSGTGKPRITLIPASSDYAEEEFTEFSQQFRPYGVGRIQVFKHDRPFTNYDANQALDTDIVFMSGGNTFYFLYHLKRSGMLWKLKSYAEDNGLLAGLSAGAIIMTSSIHTAGMPDFDADENEVGIRNLKAMNLVNFEFFPHFDNSKRYVREFSEYTQKRHRVLYTCTDGSGIVINNDKFKTVGWVWGFVRGQKFMVTPTKQKTN